MTHDSIAPHGGQLVDLMADAARAASLKEEALSLRSLDLNSRQLADVEMLMSGAYSPLRGFMGRADYEAVLADWRLAGGALWPVPITLDVEESFAASLAVGDGVALRDLEGVLIAVLRVEDIWRPELAAEARAMYGTVDVTHPGVDQLLHRAKPVYLGGRIEGVELPSHYSFAAQRHTPAEMRREFRKRGWESVAAFHLRTPIHAAQHRLGMRAMRELSANLLLNPIVTEGEDYYYRVRCYRAVLERFPKQAAMLSLLELPPRPAGMREALWHALVRQNYGCSHVVWEAGSGGYGVGAAGIAEGVERYAGELGVRLLPYERLVYVEDQADYLPVSQAAGSRVRDLSSEELQRRLREGLEIPEWFSFLDVVAELRRRYPARSRQGFTLFFTGLSGAGKSTIAKAVLAKLLELGGRPVTLLDGDVVRKNLSSELGFSREHRDLNIRRIGFVASEITKNGGIAICAPIAPYAKMRREVREMISPCGGFIEVHVATPIEVCEGRDRKGLYAKARAGIIKEFTGISDPYEAPENPELRIDTSGLSIEEAAQKVFLYLEQQGYIG